MSIFDKFDAIGELYGQLTRDGVAPVGTPIEQVLSATRGIIDGQQVVLAGTNNYLGLTFDPACVEAGQRSLAADGTGTTGSRLANGSYGGHMALEQELADCFGMRSAIVFTTGYQANLGVISTVVERGDAIVLDADSHASIYDGAKMSGADVHRFKHNDADDLAKRVRRLESKVDNLLIITEGIFSMLGDRAPIREIVEVKREHGTYLMIDEAHSFGILGDKGLGLAEQEDCLGDIDFVLGTFSKSLGSVGGYCVSDHAGLEGVRHSMRAYMFTASSTPTSIATVRAALQVMRERPELREQLRNNYERIYAALSNLGFELGPEPGPVVAARFEGPEGALAAWRKLLAGGVYVNLVVPPATPGQYSLLRCSLSAAHSDEEIEQIISGYRRIAF